MSDFNVFRTSGTDVSQLNKRGYIYITGDEDTDGSSRLLIDSRTLFPLVEKRVSGIWGPGELSLAPRSLWIGPRLGLGAAGHHLLSEDSDNFFLFHAHSQFDGELSIGDATIIEAYLYEERRILQPDNTGSWAGTALEFVFPNVRHTMLKTAYLQTYLTAASETIRIEIWEGLVDTGPLIFDQEYPASSFPASSEIMIMAEGYLEFKENTNYLLRFTSDANFSFKTDITGTLPWLATDSIIVREDDMLQVLPWVSGDAFTANESWTIQNKRIYVCNTTGVQTGTFQDNILLWDILGKKIPNIGSMAVGGNTAITAVLVINTFYDLNLGGAAVEASDIAQWTLTNTTTGELRYDGVATVHLTCTGLISAFSSGGTQRFNFRLLKNGSPLPAPDDIDIPIELKSNIAASPMLWPLSVSTGDLFRLQVENADGFSNIVIDTLKMSIC